MATYYIKNGDNYEETQAFSQHDLEEIIDKRLGRERNKYSDYEDLKKQIEDFNTLQSEFDEKLNAAKKENDDLAKQLEQAKLDTEKTKVLREFSISPELEEFITGSSVEEMRSRAEKLAHNVAKTTVEIDKVSKPEAKKDEFSDIRSSLFSQE